jgi:hypothetical protein
LMIADGWKLLKVSTVVSGIRPTADKNMLRRTHRAPRDAPVRVDHEACDLL